MRDNYQIQLARARTLFLQRDAAQLARCHRLAVDAEFLYLSFCAAPYRVRLADGTVLRQDGSAAGFEESLSIFDLLCHSDGSPACAGTWTTVYGLPHTLRSGTRLGPADREGDCSITGEQFCRACAAMGVPVQSKADLTYRVTVFGKVSVLLQFWQADEEFPAKLQFLWDSAAQDFLYFETMFYIMAFLRRKLGVEASCLPSR